MFKAAEAGQCPDSDRERMQAPVRLGPVLAQASFQLVRRLIRVWLLHLTNGEVIDLRDPLIRDLIDEGCRLFYESKQDAARYQRALALSAAQCLLLNDQLDEAIDRYVAATALDFRDSLLDAVRSIFIEAYRTC